MSSSGSPADSHRSLSQSDAGKVAMLVSGKEVYGIGTIEKLYAECLPEMLFVCLGDGPMLDWLRARSARLVVQPSPPRFVARRSVRAVLGLPAHLRRTRHAGDQLAPRLVEEGIKIVHTHRLAEQLIAGNLRSHGLRSVWQINNNMKRRRLLGLGRKLNHRMARWGADLLLPASDFIAGNWRGCGVPIKTIRNSARPIESTATLGVAPPFRCLVAGRLEASKGHHVALEAVLSARRGGHDVHLDIFGGPLDDNPYADGLRRRIREAGADEAMRLMGFCTDLRERHAEYHLGFQCRIDPEPCSLWVCETLVDGLPLIASATGGTPELVDEGVTGLLVPPDDPEALGAALAGLVSDPEALAAMRQAAAERGAAQFTTDRMMRETVEAYQTLL